MKKTILFFFSMLIFPIYVFATNASTSVGNDIGYNGCLNFQDSRVNASGQGYFGHCKKASCYTGVWKTEYYISSDMVSCTNGNRNYYVQTIRSGCTQYKGSCTPRTDVKYCSEVILYDCTKTKSGEVYIPTSSPTTQRTTVPTTKKTTTTSKKTTSTTKRTTTKSTTTTTTTAPLDSNNYLSELKLSEGSINFNKEIIIYNIEVSKDVKSIIVTATPESDKARVTIENNNEITENKPITITVVAENGSTRIYTINIKYKVEIPQTSSNNKLKNIEIKGYDFKFNPDITDYTLSLPDDVDKLDITADTEDDKAKYIISGNNKLKNRSKIMIAVTAENGDENIYTITIKKSSKLLLYFLIIMVAGVIFVFGIKLIRNLMPSKKDKNYDYE